MYSGFRVVASEVIGPVEETVQSGAAETRELRRYARADRAAGRASRVSGRWIAASQPKGTGRASAARRGRPASRGSCEKARLFQSDGALAHRERAYEVPPLYGTEKAV